MTSIQKRMSVWWVLLFLHVTTFFWLFYFGVFQYIASVDHTYISFVNIAIYVASFLFVGWKLKDHDENLEEELYPVWFASEQVLGLGMLGTVLGFIIMLSTTTNTVTDVAQLSDMLKTMSQYLGLAFNATATGIISSLLLRSWVVLFTRLVF